MPGVCGELPVLLLACSFGAPSGRPASHLLLQETFSSSFKPSTTTSSGEAMRQHGRLVSPLLLQMRWCHTRAGTKQSPATRLELPVGTLWLNEKDMLGSCLAMIDVKGKTCTVNAVRMASRHQVCWPSALASSCAGLMPWVVVDCLLVVMGLAVQTEVQIRWAHLVWLNKNCEPRVFCRSVVCDSMNVFFAL